MNKSTGIKRTLKICFVVILALCALMVGARLIFGSQRSIELTYPDKTLGILPVKNENGSVEVAPGLAFRIDTGASVSTITAAGLQRLKELRCDVDSSFYPTLGKDGAGLRHFTTKRYTVTIPIYRHELKVDSLGRSSYVMDSTSVVNEIMHVNFIPAYQGQPSVLGIDILEKFIIEYRNSPRTISLHTEVPDGYQTISSLNVRRSLADFIFNDHRYYIPLSVDQSDNMYMVDTDMDHVALRLPVRDKRFSKRRFETDTVMTPSGPVEGEVDMNAWVECGNRAGSAAAFFYDDADDEYAVNPFNFFMQDATLDFRGGKVYLRPHVKLPKRSVSRDRNTGPKIDFYDE